MIFLKKQPFTVHRQKVIRKYIVDFYIASFKTMIEIDGTQHCEGSGIEKDTERDKFLENLEIKVLRYSNYDINTNFDGVCQDILKQLKQPSPQGEV